jgi:hypothetical protein
MSPNMVLNYQRSAIGIGWDKVHMILGSSNTWVLA